MPKFTEKIITSVLLLTYEISEPKYCLPWTQGSANSANVCVEPGIPEEDRCRLGCMSENFL